RMPTTRPTRMALTTSLTLMRSPFRLGRSGPSLYTRLTHALEQRDQSITLRGGALMALSMPACHHRGVAGDWRYEANDEWLAGRRSAFFRRRRSRFAVAFADAQIGPFRAAPRNPTLKLTDKGYSHVRYAPRVYSHTAVQVELLRCGRCGRRLLEEHRLVLRHSAGPARTPRP